MAISTSWLYKGDWKQVKGSTAAPLGNPGLRKIVHVIVRIVKHEALVPPESWALIVVTWALAYERRWISDIRNSLELVGVSMIVNASNLKDHGGLGYGYAILQVSPYTLCNQMIRIQSM